MWGLTSTLSAKVAECASHAPTEQGVVSKNHLMKEQLIVINKSGGAGEGFLAIKDAKGDPDKTVITCVLVECAWHNGKSRMEKYAFALTCAATV